MQFKYGLDDKPPFFENLLLGLQWIFIAIPSILIIGKIVGGLHFVNPLDQIIYLQKMSFVMGVTLFFQVLLGHRLPLIVGPSTVLLIGVIASRGFSAEAIYSSIMIGGLLLALFSGTGLFGSFRRLFTPRVVAVVLLLIGLTLMPTVINLITQSGGNLSPWPNIVFACGLSLGMFYLQKKLRGIWKSTLIVWAMFLGTVGYYLIFPDGLATAMIPDLGAFSFFFKHLTTGFFNHLQTGLSIEPGVLISFLICFLALSINDLASIESMEEMLKPSNMPLRINRGITFTGIANVLAGFFGVVGPVNFSLSPGVILSTGCASRYTLVPTSLALFLLSFSPAALGAIGIVPSVVIGSVLVYILFFQVMAGLMILLQADGGLKFETGLVVGLPLILGTVVAFLPAGMIDSLPVTLRPVLGNGFVVGIFSAFFLEGLVFRQKRRTG